MRLRSQHKSAAGMGVNRNRDYASIAIAQELIEIKQKRYSIADTREASYIGSNK